MAAGLAVGSSLGGRRMPRLAVARSVAGGPDGRPRHVHHGIHVVRQHPAGLTEHQPPGAAKTAGGAGTYADPVTIAVGHSLETGGGRP